MVEGSVWRVAVLALGEMDEAAAVMRAAFDERLPWLAGLHTPEEDRAYFRDVVHAECRVLGVRQGSELAGILALRPGWIDQLYVRPDLQGRGIGAALLADAMAEQDTLQLWTFQRNRGARRFYARHGFTVVEETDGSGNEEREPDVRYAWTRAQPLSSV